MIKNLIRLRRARRKFRRTLALNTPLIDGRETRAVCKKIGYDKDKAIEICNGVVPFGDLPADRATYPTRLWEHLNGG